MASGRGDLERAAGSLLTVDVGEIGPGGGSDAVSRRDGLRHELAAEIGDRLGQVPDRHRLDPRKGGFGRRLGGADDPREAGPLRALRDREDAGDRADPPVEGELAVDGVPLELGAGNLTRRREHGERDRQIEPRALLAQRGGREVDGDPAVGPLALGRTDAAANTLLRLLAGAVGEPDDRERGQRTLEMRLDLDATCFETDESMRDCAREHAARLGRRSRGFVSARVSTSCRLCAPSFDRGGGRARHPSSATTRRTPRPRPPRRSAVPCRARR